MPNFGNFGQIYSVCAPKYTVFHFGLTTEGEKSLSVVLHLVEYLLGFSVSAKTAKFSVSAPYFCQTLAISADFIQLGHRNRQYFLLVLQRKEKDLFRLFSTLLNTFYVSVFQPKWQNSVLWQHFGNLFLPNFGNIGRIYSVWVPK